MQSALLTVFLGMLAFDSFPRFMKTPAADKMIAEIKKKSSKKTEDQNLNAMLASAGSQLPQVWRGRSIAAESVIFHREQ